MEECLLFRYIEMEGGVCIYLYVCVCVIYRVVDSDYQRRFIIQ